MKDSKTVCGFRLTDVNAEGLREAMKHIFQLYNEGKIKPLIDGVFALEEVSAVTIKALIAFALYLNID